MPSLSQPSHPISTPAPSTLCLHPDGARLAFQTPSTAPGEPHPPPRTVLAAFRTPSGPCVHQTRQDLVGLGALSTSALGSNQDGGLLHAELEHPYEHAPTLASSTAFPEHFPPALPAAS
ncbi:hypothetical protein K505DRAFT_380896 [Melanomma pulvis-pyrius CBS 109.77]|uniref:Uncharacterized protein n=1 Tax=Melanomma pulvis-pyrius CBS 109.77 TaxID=1314802 RepID=A0A6A6WN99_9PLEO|nr:hypothetical protein K505DRAFT_380896 [Melanomma pulvis-pyrius CBS 109.77]